MRRFNDVGGFLAEARKHDTTVRFGGRTLCVSCKLPPGADEYSAGDRIRVAASGPKLRMVFGRVSTRPGSPAVEMFVNTDEDAGGVERRVRALSPAPLDVDVRLVDPSVAERLWAALHRGIDGGD